MGDVQSLIFSFCRNQFILTTYNDIDIYRKDLCWGDKMFAALEIIKSGGIFKRRRLYRTPSVREVRVPGGLPFTVVTTALKRGSINRETVAFAAGRFKGRMLLPKEVDPSDGLEGIDTSRFEKTVLFNTAVKLLKDSLYCGERLSLCVVDYNGQLAGRLSHLVPLVSDLRIVTKNERAYESDIRRAMEEFGAAVRFCEKTQADIVLDFDNIGARGKVTFALDRGINGKGVTLPFCYSTLKPFGIEPLAFAAALYELCRITALDGLCFKDIFVDGKECSYSLAVESIKAALMLETIDI